MHPSIASKYIGAMATCGHFSALGVNQATEVRSFWSMNIRIYCLSPLSKSYHALGLVRKDAVNFYICIVVRMILLSITDTTIMLMSFWHIEAANIDCHFADEIIQSIFLPKIAVKLFKFLFGLCLLVQLAVSQQVTVWHFILGHIWFSPKLFKIDTTWNIFFDLGIHE